MKGKGLYAVLPVALILAGCGQGRSRSDRSLGQMLQRAMDDSLKDSGAIGVSAALLMPDGRLWKGAAGLSHEGVPLTPEMVFDIASVHKNLQAGLALILAEKGVFGLDDPLEKWLPPYPHIDGKITIRQLLNLTSGIDDFVADPASPYSVGYQNIDFEKIWTWEEFLDTFVGEPNFAPGEACAYSTTNFVVLRKVIEEATRSRQTAELRKRLLKPYGLDHTVTDLLDPFPEGRQPAHGWCDTNGDGTAEDVSGRSLNWAASLAPMLVYSNPEDMVEWMNALFHRKTVLKDKTLKEMLTFVGPVRNEPMMKGYGLGVMDINVGMFLPKWADVRCYGHLGSQIGYTTFVGYFPDHGCSMAIMFNRGCDADTDRAVAIVSGAMLDVLFDHLGIRGSARQNHPSR
jgi:D-alanyl-D-alanine carboxypeptidase